VTRGNIEYTLNKMNVMPTAPMHDYIYPQFAVLYSQCKCDIMLCACDVHKEITLAQVADAFKVRLCGWLAWAQRAYRCIHSSPSSTAVWLTANV
jgi:hypothetical protein